MFDTIVLVFGIITIVFGLAFIVAIIETLIEEKHYPIAIGFILVVIAILIIGFCIATGHIGTLAVPVAA